MQLKVSKIYKSFFESKNRYAILYGGAGSGKSYVTAQKILIRLISEKNHNFLVIRKVARTIRESVFALFKSLINELNLEVKINETNMTIEFNQNRIIFFGLDDREKIKSIAGISGIWIEEVTELSEEDFDQLDLRLRGKTTNYKQIILTFNPVSAEHWIKKKFFDKKVEDTFVLKTTYLDNPFVGSEYHQVMNRLKSDNYDYYKIYALGEWGNLKGLVYPKYETIEKLPEYFEEEYIGLDFGYNHPFAVVLVRIEKRNLFIKELFYKSEWENHKVIEYFNNYPHLKKVRIYADSARADLISEWKSAGYNIKKANKSVFEGINAVKSFNLYITQDSLNILREINLYSWKEDKNGNSLDEVIKLNDDALDAVRYAITPYIEKKGNLKGLKIKGL